MQCPFCMEEIVENAVKCKHCGSVLEQSRVHSSMASRNLFQEIIKDVVQKKDMDTIIGIASVVLALFFIFIGATANMLINFLFLMNPVAAGWVLKGGMTARKNGEKPKLLIIGGITFLLLAFQILYLSNGLSQLAAMSKIFGR
ncbi:MAG: hypothetical protein C0415_01630 [Thermodesulfovibrio sp.]|nr:hypothetical protein [Thermodesulfovibrio sp.]